MPQAATLVNSNYATASNTCQFIYIYSNPFSAKDSIQQSLSAITFIGNTVKIEFNNFLYPWTGCSDVTEQKRLEN